MVIIRMQGGIGNQLFQYAAAYQFCHQKKDLDLYFDFIDKKRRFGLFSLKIQLGKKLSKHIKGSLIYRIQRMLVEIYLKLNNINVPYKFLCILQKLYINIGIFINVGSEASDIPHQLYYKHNVFLAASFQCRKYHSFVIEDLKKQFIPKNIPYTEKSKIALFKNNQIVCVHIRRGDYVGNPLHEVCNLGYYRKAIHLCKENIPNCKFCFFSDDMNYVKKHFNTLRDDVVIINQSNDILCLYFMTLCNHFVLSNSSFSWWAQTLCDYEDKITIAPPRWYNGKKETGENMYLKEWIIV